LIDEFIKDIALIKGIKFSSKDEKLFVRFALKLEK
jgi:hypothetical protein